jgi:myo-inositol-1(or 4)-monophosphatase
VKFDLERRLLGEALRGFKPRLRELPREVRDKGGDLGPLTELDHYVDRELYRVVRAAFAGDGWISEESAHEPGAGRPGAGRVWIVDPIDGTREIVAGVGEWAVSVGLWDNGAPAYGWLYNASRDILWHGGPGLGAWAEEGKMRRAMRVREPGPLEQLSVGVSRTDLGRGLIPETSPRPVAIGSIAYKLGLVAAGEIDATVSVTPKNAWDIAGGIALVLGAGGTVVRLSDGGALRALESGVLQEGGLVAGHPAVVEQLRRRYGGI